MAKTTLFRQFNVLSEKNLPINDPRGQRRAVFDVGTRTTTLTSLVPPVVGVEFRRTNVDRREPRQIVTRVLLGDPPPGRSAQDEIDRQAAAAQSTNR
jgi:hypothetical protein